MSMILSLPGERCFSKIANLRATRACEVVLGFKHELARNGPSPRRRGEGDFFAGAVSPGRRVGVVFRGHHALCPLRLKRAGESEKTEASVQQREHKRKKT
jgi:hypothetical protein